MSVVSEYQHLADFVAGYAHRGEAIPPRTAAHLAAILLALADCTKILERHAVVHEPAVYADAE